MKTLIFFIFLVSFVTEIAFSQGRSVKLEVSGEGIVVGELFAVKDNNLYIMIKKVDETKLEELRTGIKIILLDSVKSASYVSLDRILSPMKGFLGGVLLGILYEIFFDIKISDRDKPEFEVFNVVLFAAGTAAVSILANYLVPDDYIPMETINADQFKPLARYPDALPGWIDKLTPDTK